MCNKQWLANVLHVYPLFKLKEQEEISASFQHRTNSCETLTDMTCMHDRPSIVLLNEGKTSLNIYYYNDNNLTNTHKNLPYEIAAIKSNRNKYNQPLRYTEVNWLKLESSLSMVVLPTFYTPTANKKVICKYHRYKQPLDQ
jgi:hypothetical protein